MAALSEASSELCTANLADRSAVALPDVRTYPYHAAHRCCTVLYRRYPHFNPQEMLEVAQIHEHLASIGNKDAAIVTFNAELDRIRTG